MRVVTGIPVDSSPILIRLSGIENFKELAANPPLVERRRT
jgi:hypothetical protein